MDGIEPAKKKSTFIISIRWIFGIFFLFACLGAILEFHFIAGLFYLLAAIIAIPPVSTELEKKLNHQMSGIEVFRCLYIINNCGSLIAYT